MSTCASSNTWFTRWFRVWFESRTESRCRLFERYVSMKAQKKTALALRWERSLPVLYQAVGPEPFVGRIAYHTSVE